jgi:hypothetical protein
LKESSIVFLVRNVIRTLRNGPDVDAAWGIDMMGLSVLKDDVVLVVHGKRGNGIAGIVSDGKELTFNDTLPAKYQPHKLSGNREGQWESCLADSNI